jgi:hypothetical protein
MGLSKVKKLGPGKVKFIHQLNDDGTAYAEDVTVESDVPGRIAYFEQQDGKVGVLSFSFSPYDTAPDGVKFPED